VVDEEEGGLDLALSVLSVLPVWVRRSSVIVLLDGFGANDNRRPPSPAVPVPLFSTPSGEARNVRPFQMRLVKS
jgi:hypothetical protein